MVRLARFGGVVLLTLLILRRGEAQTAQRLSLTDAIRLAQTRSALASGAAARLAGANARLRGAGAPVNPILALAQPFGQNTGGLDEGTVLSQTFELGDKRRQRVRAAQGERDAALADRAGVGTDLAYNAQSAYFDALRADAERKLAGDTLASAEAFATTAQTQFEAGDVARSNVVRSAIEVTRARQALTVAETDRATRYANLRSLLQMPGDAPFELTDTLTFTPKTYSLASLQALALQNRADVQGARRLREAREAALHGARAQSQPDLFIEARRSTLDPTTGGNSLRIGIQFPLFDFGRNRADARSAEAAVLDQTATLDETTRLARLDVETAYRTLEQARQTVESFQSGRLAQSKELLDMTQIGYQQGANTYLELLDAQQVYRVEQTEYARALAAYNTARAALQRAVGGTLP